MGNHSAVGHTMNLCWCTDALGFEHSAKALINLNGIEPWNARDLIRENLKKQGDLARRSPLQKIPVEDGLQFIGQKVRGWFLQTLSKEQFARTCVDLLRAQNVPHTPKDQQDLYEIFDSMDFDRSGSLSLGEWAGGLSVFFKGNQESCVHAVFKTLDGDKSGTLTKRELQEYLTPFVKAMSPQSADALRPLLLKKAVDDIYKEMDLDHQGDISSAEMLAWTKKGNNIIDRLADIIDKEVYRIWLTENHKRITKEKLTGSPGSRSPASNADGQYGGPANQFGGPPNQQYGGPPNQQYGGPPNQQYGDPTQSGMGPPGGPGYGGFNNQSQGPGAWGAPPGGPPPSGGGWGGPPQGQDWGGPPGTQSSRDASPAWQSQGQGGWDRPPQQPQGYGQGGWDGSPAGGPGPYGPPGAPGGQGASWGGGPRGISQDQSPGGGRGYQQGGPPPGGFQDSQPPYPGAGSPHSHDPFAQRHDGWNVPPPPPPPRRGGPPGQSSYGGAQGGAPASPSNMGGGYGAPPPSGGGYGAPPPSGGYGGPPPSGGYGGPSGGSSPAYQSYQSSSAPYGGGGGYGGGYGAGGPAGYGAPGGY